MPLERVSEQHFFCAKVGPLASRIIKDAVDDRGAIDFFLHQLEMQFVDDRQARQNKLASAPPAQPL